MAASPGTVLAVTSEMTTSPGVPHQDATDPATASDAGRPPHETANCSEATNALSASFRNLTRVRDDERRRLAVHLHDDAIQRMVAATWTLDDAANSHGSPEGDEACRGAMDEARTMLEQAIDSVRAVIRDLRPPSLDAAGLEAALRAQGEHILGPDGTLHLIDQVGEALPAELRPVVYRTTVEALRNVRHHAHAQHVEVMIAAGEGHLVVHVVDDGVGFDGHRAHAQAEAGHIGIISMREEVSLAGGTFEVGPRLDGRSGTLVRFALPLPTDL